MAEIFKAYDIRGVFPTDLNEDLAYKIGRAYVKYLDVKEVLIGFDMRDSCKPLFDAVAKGINDQGANVINIGMCSTPMVYFGIQHYKKESAIMITASHNPAEYNGLKMCRAEAVPVAEKEIQEIKALVEENTFVDAEQKGTIEDLDLNADYQEFILGQFDSLDLGFNVIVDCANAMGAVELPILEKAGVNVTGLYTELDGNFPNHEANPLKEETLFEIKAQLKEGNYDLGIAFDGDADRVMFLTSEGEYAGADLVTTLIAEALMNENDSILYDLRSSKIVPEVIAEMGGEPIISRVGHSFIKKTMREHGSVFGGEVSGHYYFKAMGYCESAVLAALYLMKKMKDDGKQLSELIKPLQKYCQSGEINFEVENKDEVLDAIKNECADATIAELDGLTVEYDDWWCNIRKSNTEPLLRLNLEGDNSEIMDEKLQFIKDLIEKYQK